MGGLLQYMNNCEHSELFFICSGEVWSLSFAFLLASFWWILVFSILCFRPLGLSLLVAILSSLISCQLVILWLIIGFPLMYLEIMPSIPFVILPGCLVLSWTVFAMLFGVTHVLTPIDLGLLINYVYGYTRGYLYVHRFLVSYGRPIRLLVIASINIPKVFIRMWCPVRSWVHVHRRVVDDDWCFAVLLRLCSL